MRLTNKNILYNNVPSHGATVPFGPIGRDGAYIVDGEDITNVRVKAINAVDINWNNAVVDENTTLTDTSDVLNWIKNSDSALSGRITTLEGQEGIPGKSAYEVYLDTVPLGETALTLELWLQSLKGPQGEGFSIYRIYQSKLAMYADKLNVPKTKFVLIASELGAEDPDNAKLFVRDDSINGFTEQTDLSGALGIRGKSAFELALDNGYQGNNEVEWLNSLKGKSAYQSYYDTTSDDPKLTEEEWVASLLGTDGTFENLTLELKNSLKGDPGTNCTHTWNGTTLTVTSASGTSSADLKGEKGDAFTYADFTAAQLESLKGPQGNPGEGFQIFKTYTTISAMNADAANVTEGKFVLIASEQGAEDVDNAKLYIRNNKLADLLDPFTFLTDLSGALGMKGEDGVTPTINVVAGSNINSVGTPSITKNTVGTTTTLTFDYLKGQPGNPGSNITVSSIQYVASSNGTNTPSSGWSTTIPTVNQGEYLWTKVTYSDNSVVYSKAYQGVDGAGGGVTVNNSNSTLSTSSTTIATIDGTNITLKARTASSSLDGYMKSEDYKYIHPDFSGTINNDSNMRVLTNSSSNVTIMTDASYHTTYMNSSSTDITSVSLNSYYGIPKFKELTYYIIVPYTTTDISISPARYSTYKTVTHTVKRISSNLATSASETNIIKISIKYIAFNISSDLSVHYYVECDINKNNVASSTIHDMD